MILQAAEDLFLMSLVGHLNAARRVYIHYIGTDTLYRSRLNNILRHEEESQRRVIYE
jgi:hypothetical protein